MLISGQHDKFPILISLTSLIHGKIFLVPNKLSFLKNLFAEPRKPTLPAFTCSKSTMETPGQCVETVQSQQQTPCSGAFMNDFRNLLAFPLSTLYIEVNVS